MDVYQYIAESNPYAARAICAKYGYKMTNLRQYADVGICLKKLVSAEGESAFRDVMAAHPDKEVLVELFGAAPAPAMQAEPAFSNMDGSTQAKHNYWELKANDHYMNFNAAQLTGTSNLMNLTVIAATVILGLAIISK